MSAPAIPELFFSHWQADWSLDFEVAACAGVYVWAATRVRGRWPPRRTASFLAGLAGLLVALQSGIDAYGEQLLTVHMVQHLLLLLAVPLLLLGGRPVLLALRALRGRRRNALARALERARPLAHPLLGLAVFYLVVIGTHIPALFDASLRDPLLHELQHAIYLAAGALFLWPVFGEHVPARRLGGVGSLVYVIASMPACAIVGGYLNRYPSLVYKPYAAAARALGISAVGDQQHAGALMWVGAHLFLVALALGTMLAGLLAEERRQKALDALEDRGEARRGEAMAT